MKSVTISSARKQERNAPAPPQSHLRTKTVPQKIHMLLLSPSEDPQARIAKRAYELYCERGYREGFALDDWLDAERDILSQIPPI